MNLVWPSAVVILASFAMAAFGRDAGMIQADAAFVTNADRSTLENLLDAGVVQSKAQALRQPPRMAIAMTDNAESKAYGYGDLGVVQANQARTLAFRGTSRTARGCTPKLLHLP